ncbi:HypC/HybG/HupF family hydrogenase formation chaperone [Streptomyces sp. NPDC093801]|uniref:HypC/HybG/HupF family hydrogenase formation chaperone n=1 Tax=Streptomyces sp. NPDC093801 TaxID=3155203 RepID=UPI00344DE402
MCLAVPGRVLEIGERDGTRMATVDFGGVQKEVCLEYLPDLRVGEYAIVHVGFALQRLDEESARKTLDLFSELGMLQEEFGDPWEQAARLGEGDPPFAEDREDEGYEDEDDDERRAGETPAGAAETRKEARR